MSSKVIILEFLVKRTDFKAAQSTCANDALNFDRIVGHLKHLKTEWVAESTMMTVEQRTVVMTGRMAIVKMMQAVAKLLINHYEDGVN